MAENSVTVAPRSAPLPARLWAGLLLPPLAWAIHLQAVYGVTTLTCAGSSPILLGLTLLLLCTAAAGGWLAWTGRPERQLNSRTASSRKALDEFLATVGMLASAMFTLAILTQGIPAVILEPCL